MRIDRTGEPGSPAETLHFIGGNGSGLRYRLVSAKEPSRINPSQRAKIVCAALRLPEHGGGKPTGFLADFVFNPKTKIWEMKGPEARKAWFYPDKADFSTEGDYVFEGPEWDGMAIKRSPADLMRYGAVKRGEFLDFGRDFEHSRFMPYSKEGISNTHFGLSREADELLIIDRGSTNGTYLAVGPAEAPLIEGPNGVVEVPVQEITQKHKVYINSVLARNGHSTL